jgi:hypothetical protein
LRVCAATNGSCSTGRSCRTSGRSARCFAGWRTPRAATRSARGRRSRTSPTSSTRAAARGGSTTTSGAARRRRAVHPKEPRARHPDDLRAQGALGREPVLLADGHRAGRPHAPRRELRRVPLGVRVGARSRARTRPRRPRSASTG